MATKMARELEQAAGSPPGTGTQLERNKRRRIHVRAPTEGALQLLRVGAPLPFPLQPRRAQSLRHTQHAQFDLLLWVRCCPAVTCPVSRRAKIMWLASRSSSRATGHVSSRGT